jgi:paraquat-inducible protein A
LASPGMTSGSSEADFTGVCVSAAPLTEIVSSAATEAAARPRLVECHDCGLFVSMPSLAPGRTAKCPRCNATLRKFMDRPLDRALAYALTGLVLILVANFAPFMSLRIEGRIQSASLITGSVELFERHLWALAGLVLLTTIVAPLINLGATVYVLIGLKLKTPPRHLPSVFRFLEWLHPWTMIEVYLLGVFVAYVKLIDLATIEIGVALYALASLMLIVIAARVALDFHVVWEAMEGRGLVRAAPQAVVARMIGCEECGAVNAAPLAGPHRCARCGCVLHRRRRNSVATTWALVITAAILYIPANLYPVMTVISFGRGAPDTILSGVVHLIESGMWPLALLVFFASVVVPMLKLVGLIILLISVQRGAQGRLRDRTVLYRIVESVGRWSMIDIFMLSILVALVRLGSLATIEPGVGATSFAAVVVVTMFAATAFDPRLMWDAAGRNRG